MVHQHLVRSGSKRNALKVLVMDHLCRACTRRVQIQFTPILPEFTRMLKLDCDVCERLIRLRKQALHVVAQAVGFVVIAALNYSFSNCLDITAFVFVISVLWVSRPKLVLFYLLKILSS